MFHAAVAAGAALKFQFIAAAAASSLRPLRGPIGLNRLVLHPVNIINHILFLPFEVKYPDNPFRGRFGYGD